MTPTVGFIGLGNIGGKLAGSLVRHRFDVVVRDLDECAAAPLLAAGATWGSSPRQIARDCELVITCLPRPAASAAVMEADDGVLAGLGPGKVWAEMSTTDEAEVRRLAARVSALGADAVDCPVSGGCHRAATGNVAIFAGCDRPVFDRLLPVLTVMGRRILHTGPVGSASVLKVITNYLATANLVALCDALATAAAADMDLATTYEAIRVSSGNSFVHETEGQVILSGSRDISFTMDLVRKDLVLFQAVADRCGVPAELSPQLRQVFADAQARYGPRAWSPNVIRRLEEAIGCDVVAPGFPSHLVDDEPEMRGHEVVVDRPG